MTVPRIRLSEQILRIQHARRVIVETACSKEWRRRKSASLNWPSIKYSSCFKSTTAAWYSRRCNTTLLTHNASSPNLIDQIVNITSSTPIPSSFHLLILVFRCFSPLHYSLDDSSVESRCHLPGKRDVFSQVRRHDLNEIPIPASIEQWCVQEFLLIMIGFLGFFLIDEKLEV